VVNPHQVQKRRLEIVDGDGIFCDGVAKVIGRAVCEAGLGAAAGEEGGEAARVMVAAIIRRGELAL
jgi:hypothetical protein